MVGNGLKKGSVLEFRCWRRVSFLHFVLSEFPLRPVRIETTFPHSLVPLVPLVPFVGRLFIHACLLSCSCKQSMRTSALIASTYRKSACSYQSRILVKTDNRDSSRNDAWIMTTLGFQNALFPREVDGVLCLANGGGGLEPDSEIDGCKE